MIFSHVATLPPKSRSIASFFSFFIYQCKAFVGFQNYCVSHGKEKVDTAVEYTAVTIYSQ